MINMGMINMDCAPLNGQIIKKVQQKDIRGAKMKIKRRFAREFKLSILQELDNKSMAQLCREHSLGASLVSKWKKEYSSNPIEAFRGNGNSWKEEAKIAQCERVH